MVVRKNPEISEKTPMEQVPGLSEILISLAPTARVHAIGASLARDKTGSILQKQAPAMPNYLIYLKSGIP